jgi:hypothetical protein
LTSDGRKNKRLESMAGRLKNIKIPEALPVVIQLDNTALDGFLKNLMSALQEMGSELIDAKQSASTSEATTVHVLQEVCLCAGRCVCA